MKFNLLFALPVLAISSFALTPRVLSQGSLTPPPGAPVPVMKTIQDVFDKAATVEAQSTAQTGVLSAIQAKQNGLPNRIPLVGGQPGVAVDGVTGAITISSPGSYFLTGNLNVESAAHGITIASADVTLDLNGFSVRRLTGTGGSGVLINGYFTGVDIRNGSITGGTVFGSGGTFVLAGWTNGVSIAGVITAPACRISDLRVSGTRATGIAAERGSVERCLVDTTGGTGIYAFTVSDCVVRYAQLSGISCSSSPGASVRNSYGETVAVNSSLYGIEAPNATVTNSHGSATNSGVGILADRASDSFGSSVSGTGLQVQSAQNCGGRSESGTGLSAQNAINCYGSSASGPGLTAGTASNCYGSSDTGLYGMRVQGAASFCRGLRVGGVAIDAGIAIGCTSILGSIVSFQKHLGTP